MDNIIFNGIDSRDIGCKINRVNPFAAPVPRVQEFVVPGRNGVVVVDNDTYDQLQLDYTLALYNCQRGDSSSADAVRVWLLRDGKYHRLEDSRWPDYFRLARISSVEIEQIGSGRRSIEAAVSFSCRPERFLKSGDVPLVMSLAGTGATSITIKNPSTHTAYPLIRVPSSSQVISIRVSQSTWFGYAEYAIASHEGEIEIDTDTGNAVFISGPGSGLPANGFVTLTLNGPDDFELRDGLSQIYVAVETPESAAVRIYPRWWTI